MTLLRKRHGLPEIDADDLHRIAGYIDAAIVGAGNCTRILHDASIRRHRHPHASRQAMRGLCAASDASFDTDRTRCITIGYMTAAQRKATTFRLDDDLLEGLQTVYERDGILPSEQVRRAVRTWLETKGVIEATTAKTRRARTTKGAKAR